jgi:tetratricopeptide (TPR) repeat protein
MTCTLALLLGMTAADPAALSEAARERAERKQYDEALRLWQKALEVRPDYFPALFNWGYMQYSRGLFVEAIDPLTRAVKADPRQLNARFLLGAALSNAGRGDDALRQWRAARELDPANVRLLQVMSIEYSKGRYYDDAAEAALAALALQPQDEALHLIAIQAARDAGRADAALDLARTAATRFPNSARAQFEYGFHLQRSGNRRDAIAHIDKARSLDTQYEEPFFFLGDLLAKDGRAAEAVEHFRSAIRIRPDYMAARVSLARALVELNRLEEARAELEAAVRADARHPQPHLLLSQLYFRLGDEARARAERELSLRLRRENPTALESPQGRKFQP